MFNEEWIDKQVRVRSDRVAVKIKDEDGSLLDSVLIPTEHYPLNSDKFEVFPKRDAAAITDEKVIEAFDAVKYEMGHCYSNSQNLYNELTKRGIDAKIYVGWLFLEADEYPLHHAWVVVGENVLDLSDDYTAMMYNTSDMWKKATSKQDGMKILAEFHAAAKKVSNSLRCAPFGVPTNGFLYVGSECSSDEGRKIFNELMAKFPDHKCCKPSNSIGMTETQAFVYGVPFKN